MHIFLFNDSQTELADKAYSCLFQSLKTIKEAFCKKVDSFVGEVNLIIGDSSRVHELNKQFRDVDDTTDVLAFSFEEGSLSGEVWLDPKVIKANAERFGNSFEEELIRITVHGLLHVAGYDHEFKFRGKQKTTKDNEMFKLQEEIIDNIMKD